MPKYYIVASCEQWHREGFENLEKKNDEVWCWISTQKELLDAVSKFDPRYIFFLHWRWLVPENIFKSFECVCFHMTDVPYGRGGSPLQNLIARGHKETKLAALTMEKGLDTGPVYCKKDLSLDGSAYEIYLRAGALSFEIIRWMVDDEPNAVAQTGMVTVFKRREPKQSELPPTKSLVVLHDHIRMLDAPNYPKAFLENDGFRFEFQNSTIYEDYIEATVKISLKDKQ